MTRRPGELERAYRANELRRQGLNYQAIADELGYTNASAARKAVLRGQKLAALHAEDPAPTPRPAERKPRTPRRGQPATEKRDTGDWSTLYSTTADGPMPSPMLTFYQAGWFQRLLG